MAGDIEEFLRRAAQRRAQQQQQPPKTQAPPVQGPPPQAQPLQVRPLQGQRPPSQRPKPAPPRPVQILDAEIIQEVEPSVLRGSSVAAHVQEHIRTGVFDESLSHLGEEVDRADDRMESHLHQVFEHDLGSLGSRTSAPADSTLDDDSPGQKRAPVRPTNFLELLQNPASIRQAIILSEILARPSDRW